MIDPRWLARNLSRSWSQRGNARDFVRQMLWRYAGSLPNALRRPCWTIGVRCPPPVGSLRLLLRDNNGADLFIYSEVFEQECYALPLTDPPSTILDLGANTGLSALYLGRSFPEAQLACVEPVTENLDVLRANLAVNGMTATIFDAAAHVVDGSVTMERSTFDYGHRIIDGGSSDVFTVAAMTVPTILERLGWDRVGLLKLDIEGHEVALLSERREWLHRIDALCLEYHAEGAEAHLTEVASAFGFAPPRVLPTGLWFLIR